MEWVMEENLRRAINMCIRRGARMVYGNDGEHRRRLQRKTMQSFSPKYSKLAYMNAIYTVAFRNNLVFIQLRKYRNKWMHIFLLYSKTDHFDFACPALCFGCNFWSILGNVFMRILYCSEYGNADRFRYIRILFQRCLPTVFACLFEEQFFDIFYRKSIIWSRKY